MSTSCWYKPGESFTSSPGGKAGFICTSNFDTSGGVAPSCSLRLGENLFRGSFSLPVSCTYFLTSSRVSNNETATGSLRVASAVPTSQPLTASPTLSSALNVLSSHNCL